MSAKQLITIFGATGNQGGSVVNAIQQHPSLSDKWLIRGVTRDTTTERAKALQSKGVETVTADLNDPASLEKALTGSDAVYAVTDYWEKLDKALEIQQGKNIADAAKKTGVKHLIFSSLANVTQVSGGKLTHVEHFDSKAEVEEYIRLIGVPASFFQPGPYMSSIIDILKGQKKDDVFNFALPFKDSDTMPLFDVRDTGAYVAAIMANRDALLGQRIAASSGFYTGPEIISAVGALNGKKANFVQVTEEQFEAAMPAFAAKEFAEMFLFMRDHDYYGREGAKQEVKQIAEQLGIKPRTWEEAIKEVKDW